VTSIGIAQDNDRPTSEALIRHSRPPKPGGSCGGSDFHDTSKGASWLNMIEIEIEHLAGKKMPLSLDR
jgi:hypothetical protein